MYSLLGQVGHVKRHGEGTNIRLRLLPALTVPTQPVQTSLCQTLMGRTKNAERERDKVQYGCRLCEHTPNSAPPRKKRILVDKTAAPMPDQSKDATSTARGPAEATSGDQGQSTQTSKEERDRPLPKPVRKQLPLYSFNGLRSHLKAKCVSTCFRSSFGANITTADMGLPTFATKISSRAMCLLLTSGRM